jgi:hypothetical protein
MGEIECLFVTTEKELAAQKGYEICLYEALGKHSDVTIIMNDENTKIISDDQDKIQWLLSLDNVIPVGWDLVQRAVDQKEERGYEEETDLS